MGEIILRHFAWTERPRASDPYPEVATIRQVGGERELSIDLSTLISVNALATPVTGPARYEARRTEVRLLLSYLEDKPGERIRLRDEQFHASSAHVRKLVSESFGLGMLAATISAAYESFDALPTALISTQKTRNSRPDLLFDLPELLLAGEARGRVQAPGNTFTQQRKRLDSLLPWSYCHGRLPMAMAWSHATKRGIVVDLYTRPGGLPGVGPLGRPLPEPFQAELDLPDIEENLEPDPRTAKTDRGKEIDRRSPRDVAAELTQRIGDVTRDLYASAPLSDIRIADQPLRGDWAPLDLVSESSGSFLLGLLERPLSREDSQEITERWRLRELDALVSGRLVVAVSNEPAGQPWDLVTA